MCGGKAVKKGLFCGAFRNLELLIMSAASLLCAFTLLMGCCHGAISNYALMSGSYYLLGDEVLSFSGSKTYNENGCWSFDTSISTSQCVVHVKSNQWLNAATATTLETAPGCIVNNQKWQWVASKNTLINVQFSKYLQMSSTSGSISLSSSAPYPFTLVPCPATAPPPTLPTQGTFCINGTTGGVDT